MDESEVSKVQLTACSFSDQRRDSRGLTPCFDAVAVNFGGLGSVNESQKT